MNPYKITFQTWNKIAETYQEKFMHIDLYNDTYDIFCRETKKSNSKIFDIACGPGNITKYLLSKRPDFEIEAIDISPNMVKLARINNPAVKFKIMDCRNIDSLASKYEGIICGFCMPYLSKQDVAKLIKDCSCLLNSNGIFYFSTIEDDYSKSGYETDSSGQNKVYVYYHEKKYLHERLLENNFEILELKLKNYTKSDNSISKHLIYIAKKK